MSFLSTRRFVAGAVLISAAVLLSSCGNTYRATVGITNPPPPPTQNEYLPVVISQVPSQNGLASILDVAGDSLLVQVPVGQTPVNVALGAGGGTAYVVNLAAQVGNYYQGSLSSFSVITTLQPGNVNTSSLNSQTNVFVQPASPQPNLCVAGTVPNPPVFVNGNVIYVGQTGSNYVLPLASNATSTGVPGVLSQLQTAGIITNFAGLTTGERTYAIETGVDTVQVLDSYNLGSNSSPAISATIPLTAGTGPNYGLMSPDGNYVYVMDCDGTVTVLSSQANGPVTLNAISPITLPASSDGTPAGSPIGADYVNVNNVLVTANTNGTGAPGTASIINASAISASFGHAVTVTVGKNPSGVAVLQSNDYAYVLNSSGDSSVAGQSCGCSMVSVINLTSKTTNPTTIPLTYSYAGSTYACPVNGATQIVSSPGTSYQQVFVLCTAQNPTDGAYYVYSIRTYQDAAVPSGQSSAANVVNSVIPIAGIPQAMRMTPTR